MNYARVRANVADEYDVVTDKYDVDGLSRC